jgi:hypothetical protein
MTELNVGYNAQFGAWMAPKMSRAFWFQAYLSVRFTGGMDAWVAEGTPWRLGGWWTAAQPLV